MVLCIRCHTSICRHGIKGYNLAREGKAKMQSLMGSWYVFLTGLFMLLAGGLIAAIGKYMAIGSNFLIPPGRHEKNQTPFQRRGSLYNTVGLKRCTVLLRLLALGLATGLFPRL